MPNTPVPAAATGLPIATLPTSRKVQPFGLNIALCEAVTLPPSGLQLVAAGPGSFLFGGRAHA